MAEDRTPEQDEWYSRGWDECDAYRHRWGLMGALVNPNDWLPIDTMPDSIKKDGIPIRLTTINYPYVNAKWFINPVNDKYSHWGTMGMRAGIGSHDEREILAKPTHWMPMPQTSDPL